MLGHAELLGRGSGQQLYWVESNAEHQGQTHAREFDAVEVVNGRALACRLRGRWVLYVAPFADWPQYRADDLANTLAACRHAQGISVKARARWQRFTMSCRPRLGWSQL